MVQAAPSRQTAKLCTAPRWDLVQEKKCHWAWTTDPVGITHMFRMSSFLSGCLPK
ncbi:hypothetical protein Nmel_002872 [Mimus melanotis]